MKTGPYHLDRWGDLKRCISEMLNKLRDKIAHLKDNTTRALITAYVGKMNDFNKGSINVNVKVENSTLNIQFNFNKRWTKSFQKVREDSEKTF